MWGIAGCSATPDSGRQTEGGGSGGNAAMPGRAAVVTTAAGLGEAVCACYTEMAEAVRVSQTPAYRDLSEQERARYDARIDSLSKQGKACFAGAKAQHGIAEKGDQWSAEQKQMLEEGLAQWLEAQCPNVATLLSDGQFY